MSFAERLKMFNQGQKTNPTQANPKPEIKKFNQDRLAFLNQINNSGKEKNPPSKTKPNKLVNIFEKDKDKKEIPNMPTKDRKQTILEKSSIISDENADKIIRKYPKLSLTAGNCKILLLIGDNQDEFINTLINMYSNINYKDTYRYKVENSNLNGDIRTYSITSIPDGKDIFIISFPSFNKMEDIFNNKVMEKYKDLVTTKIIKKINYIFITIEKNKILDKKELIFFIYFINVFFDENLKKRIIIVFSTEKDSHQGDNNIIINDIFKDSEDNFLSEENLGFNFNSLFTPEYFYINNKIIFEKNNNSEEEEEWKALSEVMKIIQNKISSSIGQAFNTDNISLINKIINPSNKAININIPELKKIEKKSDRIILFNYLVQTNIKNDISAIILYLLQMINNKIKVNKLMKEIILKDLKNLHIDICFLSKIELNNIKSIIFQNCDIENQIINRIKNVFTSKLEHLNMSKNKLTNLEMFNNENIFNNLIDLDLSYNNIEEINTLMMGKFPNLKKINLSHNKISNIKCMEKEIFLNNLEELDLSNNNIRELNRINIENLKFLTMTNNEISEGIFNFSELSYGVDELVLNKNNDNELNFEYSKFDREKNKPIKYITFKYSIEKNEMNKMLEKIKFKGINKFVLKGFENIDFLINDTLDMLTELDLRNITINDISVFSNVKFNNLQELYFQENNIILNGYNSLKKFNKISFKIIEIKSQDNKYKCKVIYNADYSINFIFDDLEFLKDELVLKSGKIDLEQSIWDNNIDFFFEAIQKINSYPFFKIKPSKLNINSKNNKFEVSWEKNEFYSNLNMHFILNDLNIFKLQFFNLVTEIEFDGVKFDDNTNIDLSKTVLPNLKRIKLFNNTIGSVKIMSVIDEMRKHIEIDSSFSNKCDNKLLEFLDNQVSMEYINTSQEDVNTCIIKYNLPFNFSISINKKD
jgi:hypothetical protein